MRLTLPEFEPTVPALLAHWRGPAAANHCVLTPGGAMTYGELDRRSRNLAAALLEEGVGKGSRVGVLFPNGADWVVAWAAVTRLGAVALPVNTFYTAPELQRFLVHSDLQVLLGVSSFIGHDYVADLAAAVPGLDGHRTGQVRVPGLPHLRSVLFWDAAGPAWAEDGWSARAEQDCSPAAAAMVEAIGETVTPGDPMVVVYTSGSTGDPKGVVHGHGALIRHGRNLAGLGELGERDRIWTPMPLCWIGGLSFVLLRALTVGAAVVVQERFDPAETLALLETHRVSVVSAWPAACKSVVDQPGFAGADLSSVRSGGLYDALPPPVRPADPGLMIGSLGMTETAGPHTFFTQEEGEAGTPEEYRGAFGHEVPGVEHRIVDPDTGAPLPDGEPGEVLVRGYSLMLGMYKRERADVFDADGWYHTGDRGYFRDDWFFFVERQTEMIKTKGSNVSPSEVEACLLARDGVKLAFVVGVDEPERGQDVVALVVPWGGARLPPAAELRDSLKGEIASYKLPRHLFVVEEDRIPWLASQKADRRALRALAGRLVAAGGAD